MAKVENNIENLGNDATDFVTVKKSDFENKLNEEAKALIAKWNGKTPMNVLYRSTSKGRTTSGTRSNNKMTLQKYALYILGLRCLSGQNYDSMLSKEEIEERGLTLAPYAQPFYDEEGNEYYDLSSLIGTTKIGQLFYEQNRTSQAGLADQLNKGAQDMDAVTKACQALSQVTGITLNTSTKANTFMPSRISSLKHGVDMLGRGKRFNAVSGVLYMNLEGKTPTQVLTTYISRCATMSVNTNFKNVETQLFRDRDFLALTPEEKKKELNALKNDFKNIQYDIHSICSDLIASEMIKTADGISADERKLISQGYLLSATQRINSLGEFANNPYLMSFVATTVTDAVSRFEANYQLSASQIRDINESLGYKKEGETGNRFNAVFGEYKIPFAGDLRYSIEKPKAKEAELTAEESEEEKHNENEAQPAPTPTPAPSEVSEEEVKSKFDLSALSADQRKIYDGLNDVEKKVFEKWGAEDYELGRYSKNNDAKNAYIQDMYNNGEITEDATYRVGDGVSAEFVDGDLNHIYTSEPTKVPFADENLTTNMSEGAPRIDNPEVEEPQQQKRVNPLDAKFAPKVPKRQPKEIDSEAGFRVENEDISKLFGNVALGERGKEIKGTVGIVEDGKVIPTEPAKEEEKEEKREEPKATANEFDVDAETAKAYRKSWRLQERPSFDIQEGKAAEATRAYFAMADGTAPNGEQDLETAEAYRAHQKMVDAEIQEGVTAESVASFFAMVDAETEQRKQEIENDPVSQEEMQDNKELTDEVENQKKPIVKRDERLNKGKTDKSITNSKGTFGEKSDTQIRANIDKYLIQMASKALAEKTLQDKHKISKVDPDNDFALQKARVVAGSQSSIESLFNNYNRKDDKIQGYARQVLTDLVTSNAPQDKIEGVCTLNLLCGVYNEANSVLAIYKALCEKKNLSKEESALLEGWKNCKTTASFMNYYANKVYHKTEVAKDVKSEFIRDEQVRDDKRIIYGNAVKNSVKQECRKASGQIVILQNLSKAGTEFIILNDGRVISNNEKGNKHGAQCFKIYESVKTGSNDAKVVENSIYTDYDLIALLKYDDVYSRSALKYLVNREEIENATKDRGGYLGWLDFTPSNEIYHRYEDKAYHAFLQDAEKKKNPVKE